MITNYYNSSNNYSTPIKRNEPSPHKVCRDDEKPSKITTKKPDTDNIVLLIILAVLYLTECDDKWIMLALLYLLLA